MPRDLDLTRAAVQAPGWRWMAGMRDTTGRLFVADADCGEAAWLWVAEDGCEWLPVEGRLPALDDHATRGCLLALVREAWWSRYVWVQPYYLDGVDGYAVIKCPPGDFIKRLSFAPSESAALVAALVAAPVRR